MTNTALDKIIARQEALIAALDARDADAIEAATAELADAVNIMKAQDVWHETPEVRGNIEAGLKLADAARMRVNYLADWTRQRLDQLNDIRAGETSYVYKNHIKTAY